MRPYLSRRHLLAFTSTTARLERPSRYLSVVNGFDFLARPQQFVVIFVASKARATSSGAHMSMQNIRASCAGSCIGAPENVIAQEPGKTLRKDFRKQWDSWSCHRKRCCTGKSRQVYQAQVLTFARVCGTTCTSTPIRAPGTRNRDKTPGTGISSIWDRGNVGRDLFALPDLKD